MCNSCPVCDAKWCECNCNRCQECERPLPPFPAEGEEWVCEECQLKFAKEQK